MDLDGDLSISFVAQLPFGTLEFVTSRVMPMRDYTATETAKVVSLSILLFKVP